MITTTSQIIEQALIEAGMSKTELAKALGISRQALYQRLSTGKFSYSDLQKIAAIMGARLQLRFEFEQER